MRITDIKGIAPTNYKKGTLIINKYRKIDMLIMIGSFIWAFVWMMLMFFVFVPNMIFFMVFVILIPIIAIGLVQPMPNYHNNLEYILLQLKWQKRVKHYSNILIRKKNDFSEKKKKGKKIVRPRKEQ
ncbi:hypothetical protein KB151_003882 [[Clostridium] innocuum]|nr:hypothetical protein [[Clostridium] innocuum]